MAQITITVTYSKLLPKVKKHLSVVGKRAHTVDGKPLFSDIMASTNEDSFFNDLFDMAAENLVASLPDLCTSYNAVRELPTIDNEPISLAAGNEQQPPQPLTGKKIGVTFNYVSDRWKFSGAPAMDLTVALTEATENYLYNYALSQFLTDIHPSTGAKYPPLWGQTYIEHSAVIINNIRSLALLKRPVVSTMSYASISATIEKEDPEEPTDQEQE